MKYCDRILWVENIEKNLKLFLRKKGSCYKRLILLRRTILTEERRKSVKSVFKEEVLEK